LDYLYGEVKSEKYYYAKKMDEIVAYIYTQVQVTDILFAGDLNSSLKDDNV